MAGIGQVGRDHYGVFPLRGKLLNVREANTKQLTENAEIQNIKKILGLQHDKKYDSTNGLRYGHLMIMTDQVRLATSPVLSQLVKMKLFLGLL
jgi:DNA topoisomerase-2